MYVFNTICLFAKVATKKIKTEICMYVQEVQIYIHKLAKFFWPLQNIRKDTHTHTHAHTHKQICVFSLYCG